MEDTKRIDFIDVAKGIAIFLVVYGHTYDGRNLHLFIYSFHMPLFFFISGLLFKENKYANFILFVNKKAKTLLLPYMSFYIITYLYWFFIERHYRPEYNVSFEIPLIGLVYGTYYGKYMSPNVVLWFLTCLFVTETFLYFILKLFKNVKTRILVFVIFAISGYLFSLINTLPPPFSSGVALMALLFMGSGYLFKKSLVFHLSKISRVYCLLLSIILFIFVYFLSMNNGKVSMASMNYGNPILFITYAYIGIMATILLSYSINKNSVLQYFGVNTLIFVGLSEPIKRITLALFSILTKIPMSTVRNSILLTLIAVSICFIVFIPIIWFFNKYLYLLLGKTNYSHYKITDKVQSYD